MSYLVRLERNAERDLDRLPGTVLTRVDAKLTGLKTNPRPRGAVKLHGREGLGWRIRVGDYRILYTIDEVARVVSVYRIRSRASAYHG